ncbi:LysR family transcriptional regulator [Pseudoalteromonas sp. MMG013]|uniref:LysR family transcriptional regulator n=1 Tax=Pseudoalteromonas sp. MMG013 TaxID=2822687 RepID=UPI001B35FCCB|nr:LysR family transcriptional regulator [Pseudoalteromonas sp. MMG013]MBQ4864353.1 LysR family transcriptional regulator [Pseudoalteromonas sp. MMG013]
MRLKTTLEQWSTLSTIDEFGSIQSAAQEMHKSHTTLIYSIRKLEAQLGVELLEVVNKRAVLTAMGKTLLRSAKPILDQAKGLEDISMALSLGTESEVVVSIDHLCDKAIVYQSLKKFMQHNVMTSVKLIETSLSSTHEAVVEQRADIAIITLPIINLPAESIGVTSMIPVVAATHPLAGQTDLTMEDLVAHTQIVLRDLGVSEQASSVKQKNVGWLKSKRRVTVDNFEQAITAVKHGLGFTRIPQHMLNDTVDSHLTQLRIQGAGCYQVPLHITLPKGLNSGPAAQALYDLIVTSHGQAREKL